MPFFFFLARRALHLRGRIYIYIYIHFEVYTHAGLHDLTGVRHYIIIPGTIFAMPFRSSMYDMCVLSVAAYVIDSESLHTPGFDPTRDLSSHRRSERLKWVGVLSYIYIYK